MHRLYLIRLVLDRRSVLRVGARHRLGHAADEGALLHAGLSQLFATSADPVKAPLCTFAVDNLQAAATRDPEALPLLAYSPVDAATLTDAMGPARSELVRECRSREMPEFSAGQRLGFRTRVCPVARTRRPGNRPLPKDRHGRVKHREMDAFVHAALGLSQEARVDREAVYSRWLDGQLRRGGASRLVEHAELVEFRREGMRRGGGPRLERPNAVLEGVLAIEDPQAFRALLARGVGRHRAFGFGMLLLRPAST
jgi:CRISPR system Cascade subunit CasE